MTGAVDQNIVRVHHPQAPGGGAISGDARAARAEIRVSQGRVDGEGNQRIRRWHEIRCLRLELRGENVLAVGDLIVVQDMMFDRGADQPNRPIARLNVQSPTGIDGGLRIGSIIDVVVCRPQPCVLHVQTGRRCCDVHAHVCGNARRNNSRRTRTLGTLCNLELGPCEAANTCVDIPHTRGRAAGRCEIPFNQDGAWSRALRSNDEIRELDCAGQTRGRTNLDDRLGGGNGGPVRSASQEDWVAFAHNLGTWWNYDRRSESVETEIDKDNFAGSGGSIDGGLDGSGL